MIREAEKNEKGYIIPNGFSAIFIRCQDNVSRHSGYMADNHRKETLFKVAKMFNSKAAVMHFFDNQGRYCRAEVCDGFYTIWHDGECIFSQDGDPIAVMDADGIL